jgi:hypothetical protein
MTWKRYYANDWKDDYEVVTRSQAGQFNNCRDCGNAQYGFMGRRIGTSWAGRIKAGDVRIKCKGSSTVHFISRRKFLDPMTLEIQRGAFQLRCGRYIALPTEAQIQASEYDGN